MAMGWPALSPRARGPALAAAAVLTLLLGCGPQAPAGPLGFSLDYATGSIPPPYNHRYTVDVTFDEEGAMVTYQLEYLYRDGLSEAELGELGYTPDDDILWSGRFSSEDADRWREVAGTSVLSGRDEPLPGGDTMLIRVSDTEETFRAGTPVDRRPWQDIAREVDQAARQELATERTSP